MSRHRGPDGNTHSAQANRARAQCCGECSGRPRMQVGKGDSRPARWPRSRRGSARHVTGPPAAWDRKGRAMSAFFKLMAAGPMFFVSAWLLMIFAGIVSKDAGIAPFGYVTSMVVTIGLWLTLAPAIGAVAQVSPRKRA